MDLTRRRRTLLLKTGVWLAGLSPLAWGLRRFFLGDGFGVNPIEAVEHFTGGVTLVALLVVLTVTPVRRLTGWNLLQKTRRPLGLFAFFWACLHFLAWIGLDQFFAWEYIGEDIAERPYILVGFLSFLMLLALALTSTRGWIRRLGKTWVHLHRLVYPAALLGVVHFFWVTKADDRQPMLALGAWAVLMVLRLPFMELRPRRGAREPSASR